MKDIRTEVRMARMKKGVKYTALLNKGPGYSGLLFALNGKRVTIKNIRRTGRDDYPYRVDIAESTVSVLPYELSEWREE